MAKGGRIMQVHEISFSDEPIVIKSKADAAEALAEMERINEQLVKAQQRTVDLKKAVTEYAVAKSIDVIQIDGAYYRQIERTNTSWDADTLKEVTKGAKGPKGKPLWNFITRRVPDPEKINAAVEAGYISEKKIKKAFKKTKQNPFLQRYVGEAADG